MCSRSVQMGSWWLTQTAACPRAASRAASTAAIIASAVARSGQRIGVRSTSSRVTVSMSHSAVRWCSLDTQATISTP
jgi:hypothetical protein